MYNNQHVLVVPFPAQGHVTPLMKLSHKLAAVHGIKVTFSNTEFIEKQVVAAMSETDKERCPIRLVSFSDGLDLEDNRKDGFKLTDSLKRVMSGNLKDLIEKINLENDEPVTCLVVDATVGWTLEVASEMGLKQVVVWPAGPGSLAFLLHIPKLIESGIIDLNGNVMKDELLLLSKEIPALRSTNFPWSWPDNPAVQKLLYDICLISKQAAENASMILCNTCYELDSSACDMIPNILPVGPLFTSHHLSPSDGSFFLQDSSCLTWLDEQPAKSVVYASFGSTTMLTQTQFHELALGLELSGKPFLWVVRSESTYGSFAEFPNGFLEKVADRGKIVKWAPQDKVLAHPSISCFFSHCGWNSTMEGLSFGVPFLCWPYFSDQFHNQDYICAIWKIGLKVDYDENGIISRHEIKTKIDNLLSTDEIKVNAVKLMEKATKSEKKGGSSFENFERFVKYLKH